MKESAFIILKVERSNVALASMVTSFALESDESLGYLSPVERCGMLTIEFTSGTVPVSQLVGSFQSSEVLLHTHIRATY